ncbi:MAG: hypothetical protein JWL67_869 [Solirubrobacterales bacterium]|jgi:hypothetical protein|nr:hypothetical protein [Solirubrobacterales bacterium]
MPLRKFASILVTAFIALLAVPAASMGLQVGIGDNSPRMFAQPYYKALHTKIARYVAPYDVADRPRDLAVVNAWITAAEAERVQPLIAFYHSRSRPNQLPSPAKYSLEIKRFIALHPSIKVYTAWNEANRGARGSLGADTFRSPSAKAAAGYYLALKAACPKCTIVGLDVLDSTNIASTVKYIHTFQRYARGRLPSIWGLHNYSDTNRFRSAGTRAVLAAVHGQVWLTETGGVVKFGSEFPNRHGSGLKRAKQALTYLFKLAGSNHRITRLYIFDWFGGSASARFDAGLVDHSGKPRPGYSVVRKRLRG